MWWWILWASIVVTNASYTTIQVIGEPYSVVHQNNDLVFRAADTSHRVRVCLVFGWSYVPGEPRATPLCSYVTPDCRCYVWQNTHSADVCVDIWLNDTTTLEWYLLPLHGVQVLQDADALRYSMLQLWWPSYTIGAFADAVCALAVHTDDPPDAFRISHQIRVFTVTPGTNIINTTLVSMLVVLGYIAFIGAILLWHVPTD